MLTYGELGWVLEEIAPLAVGAIVQKVWESGERGVVLQLRRPGRTLLLLLALHPRFGRANLERFVADMAAAGYEVDRSGGTERVFSLETLPGRPTVLVMEPEWLIDAAD